VTEKIKPASPFSQTRKKKTQTPNPLFFPNSKPQLAEPRETQQNKKIKIKILQSATSTTHQKSGETQ
jgi:hypothetical protein